MSGLELGVVVLGLCIGYWVVSRFLTGKTSETQSSGKAAEDPLRNTAEHEVPEDSFASDCFRVLNVSSQASVDEIRRAYKVLLSQYHPDKVATLGDELKALAEKKSKEITAAYREAMRIRGESH